MCRIINWLIKLIVKLLLITNCETNSNLHFPLSVPLRFDDHATHMANCLAKLVYSPALSDNWKYEAPQVTWPGVIPCPDCRQINVHCGIVWHQADRSHWSTAYQMIRSNLNDSGLSLYLFRGVFAHWQAFCTQKACQWANTHHRFCAVVELVNVVNLRTVFRTVQ